MNYFAKDITHSDTLKNTLIRICDKTIGEKYLMPDVDFNFFGTIEGKGMYVKESYIQMAKAYEHIDMMYELFEWQNGVGFYAVIQAGNKLGTDRYIRFVKEWVDFHLQKGLPDPSINSTSPFLSILEIYLSTGEQTYFDLCEARAEFIMTQAIRTDEGAFEHTVLEKNHKFTQQIWADTLFMGVLFLAKWGVQTNNESYLEEAVDQFLIHYKYLTDSQTGLIFHGYSCIERSNLSAVRWGRANGWALIAMVELLDILPDHHHQKQRLLTLYSRHMNAVLSYQNADGSFYTVLDQRKTYKETTIVSAVAFSLRRGMKRAYLDASYQPAYNKALDYLMHQVTTTGVVEGCSGGTPIMCSIEEYNKIPYVMSYYGQGMAIMALYEGLL